jgi:hypothetical protein
MQWPQLREGYNVVGDDLGDFGVDLRITVPLLDPRMLK